MLALLNCGLPVKRIARRIPLMGERGASAVEYGIMVVLVAAVVLVAVVVLGNQTSTSIDCTATAIADKGATSC